MVLRPIFQFMSFMLETRMSLFPKEEDYNFVIHY